MSYSRPVRWEEGEALCACDICGFPYRYPSELIYANDKLFYCRRTCWLGKTPLDDQNERAAAHQAHEEQPFTIGKTPDWWE